MCVIGVNDVHSQSGVTRSRGGGPRPVSSGPAPGEADGGLAAAIVEEFEVGTAKVSIGYAVDKVVEAGLGEREPDQTDYDVGIDGLKRADTDGDSTGQPENDKKDAAGHVGFGELVVPGEGDAGLVGAARAGAAHVGHQARVDQSYGEDDERRGRCRGFQARGVVAVETTRAEVGTEVEGGLDGYGDARDQPN